MRRLLLGLAIPLALAAPSLADPAAAADGAQADPASAHVGDSSGGPPMTELYPYLAVEKFGRGVANLLGAPAEVWIQARRAFEARARRGGNYAENNAAGVAGGVVGVGYTVARIGIGVADVATFWWPYWDPFIDPSVPHLSEDTGFQRDRDALPPRHRQTGPGRAGAASGAGAEQASGGGPERRADAAGIAVAAAPSE